MSRPRILDLFCGAGGAAMGYHRAGFDVVGIDIKPQPNYPFFALKDDALEYVAHLRPLYGFHAIHASPPCQVFTAYKRRGGGVGDGYLDLIAETREALRATKLPYIIENVPGAPLTNYVQLCGSSFGLGVRRERWFETNWPLMVPPCAHGLQRGDYPQATNRKNRRRTAEIGVWRIPLKQQQAAMGIDWMTLDELTLAVPPAFTEYVGSQLFAHLRKPHRENILRGMSPAARQARQTHCVNGHEFTAENTYWSNPTTRACRACHRVRQRERMRRLRARLKAAEAHLETKPR